MEDDAGEPGAAVAAAAGGTASPCARGAADEDAEPGMATDGVTP